MKRTHRLRRLAAATALGVGMVGSVVGVAAGTAGATTTTKVGTLATTNPTTIPNGTTANQKIGTVVVTIDKTAPTGTYSATFKVTVVTGAGTVTFTVTNSDAFEKVTFTGPGKTLNCLFTTAGVTSKGVKCTVTKTGTTLPVVITAKTMRVNSTKAKGKVAFETTAVTAPSTVTGPVVSPTTIYPASYTTAPPAPPASAVLDNNTLRPIPPVGEGATGTPAGSWSLTLGGTSTTTEGVGAGGHVKIVVEPHNGKSSCATTDTVAFDGVPKVAVTAATGTTVPATKITVKAALSGTHAAATKSCTAFFAPNALTIAFTSTVHFTTKSPLGSSITLSITTVKYSAAPTTTTGLVTVSGGFYPSSSSPTATPTFTAVAPATSDNAIVSDAYVTVATSTKTVSQNAYDHPIGAVSLVETVPFAKQLSTAGTAITANEPASGEYVCITVTGASRSTATGNKTAAPKATAPTTIHFNATATPTVKVTGGNATATTVGYATKGATPSTVRFKVPSQGTTASTFTVSGLAVNLTGTATHPQPVLTAFYSASTTCAPLATPVAPTDNVAVIFPVTAVPQQIYGATADATAAAELETAYKPSKDACPLDGTPTPFFGGFEHPVVLSRDTTYPDALASQYLAGLEHTGTLLTPTTTLAAVTANALRLEGISHVYVVGGPLAISTAVISQIEAMSVYNCGGTAVRTNITGGTTHIVVTRIAGQTEYGTAAKIAMYKPAATVQKANLSGVYSGTNKAGGNGMDNATSGLATTAPRTSGPLHTAILATGQGFQDAESASVLAYHGFPIVLTPSSSLSPTAVTALQTLNIAQVIVMGGPLAISNTVVKSLQKMTISVLRVAGATFQQTSVETAHLETFSTATHDGLGWTTGGFVLVARGTFFSDGLAGAVLGGSAAGTPTTTAPGHPLLLTMSPSTVGPYLTTYLKSHGTVTVTSFEVLGGPIAVNPSTIVTMENDLKS